MNVAIVVAIVDFKTIDMQGQWSWTSYKVGVSWNDLFYDIGPLMINEATDGQLRAVLHEAVERHSEEARDKDERLKDHKRQYAFEIADHDFQTIKIQLRALGLIMKSQKQRSIKDVATYWTLSPYGDQLLTTLRAIPKTEGAQS